MKVIHNYSQNGIEMYFENCIPDNILDLLRSQNWKWHRTKQCWYNTETPFNAQFADAFLCSSLKSRLLGIGCDYDNEQYQETISSLSVAIHRMKQRNIRVNNLLEYEHFVTQLQIRDKRIAAERQAKAEEEREHKKDLIQIRHMEFVRKAKSDFLRNEDAFWSDYGRLIEFVDYEDLCCSFAINNPDSYIASLERTVGYVYYDRIKFTIIYDLYYKQSGQITFGKDKFDISEASVSWLLSKHISYDLKNKIHKEIQKEIVKDVKRKGLGRKEENTPSRGTSYRVVCRKCQQYKPMFRDEMCWDCYKEEMQSYDVD